MGPGDLVRFQRSFRTLYGPGQVVEFVAGTHALVVSRFTYPGRTYYNVLYNGQVLAVDRLVIESVVPCDRPVPVV